MDWRDMVKKQPRGLKNGQSRKMECTNSSPSKKKRRLNRTHGQKAHYEELLERARATKDFNERKSLVARAREVKAEYERKFEGSAAQRRAWKALQRVKWEREKERW
jgi:hypothetical protein